MAKKRVESTLIIEDKFCLVVTPISEPNSTLSPITTIIKKKKKKGDQNNYNHNSMQQIPTPNSLEETFSIDASYEPQEATW